MRKYKIAAIILAVFLLLVSWFYISDCKQWKKERSYHRLNDSKMQKKILDIRDSSGKQIQVYQLQDIRTNDLLESSSIQVQQLRADLDKAHLNLKKVRSTVQLGVNTQGEVKIDANDTLRAKADDSGAFDEAMVVIPFGDSSDNFTTITGNANFQPIAKGFVFKGIDFDYRIKDTFTVTHALTGGFLKKQGVALMVTSASPHSTIEKVQSYYVTVEKKWFQHWYVQAGAGMVVGILIASKL